MIFILMGCSTLTQVRKNEYNVKHSSVIPYKLKPDYSGMLCKAKLNYIRILYKPNPDYTRILYKPNPDYTRILDKANPFDTKIPVEMFLTCSI